MRARVELAKRAGYFLFRGGEAEEWIDRTVRVATISSLTLEEWLDEYKRLKSLNLDMMKKAAKQPSPRAQRDHHEAPAPGAPIHPALPGDAPPRDSTRKEACTVRAKLLADLDQEHKDLLAIEEQEVRAAREGRVSDLVTLSADTARERGKFDRALLAVRDHALVHGC
jgi:hypothetical protein